MHASTHTFTLQFHHKIGHRNVVDMRDKRQRIKHIGENMRRDREILTKHMRLNHSINGRSEMGMHALIYLHGRIIHRPKHIQTHI